MMKKNKRVRAEEIPILVENELLKKIQDIYEEVTTTAKFKKQQREKYTIQFVEKYSKELSLPEDNVRSIVDIVIAKARWIEEIEELDEEQEDER